MLDSLIVSTDWYNLTNIVQNNYLWKYHFCISLYFIFKTESSSREFLGDDDESV